MKKNTILCFLCLFTNFFSQKYYFNAESKWFLNEYTGKGELIEGSESKVKTTLTLHIDKEMVFIERDIYKNNEYLKTKVNQYNIVELIEKDDLYLLKTADLFYREYVEIILAKNASYLTVSTKCDSKNCSEFNAYY